MSAALDAPLWRPEMPFNDLPPLPPAIELETKAVLKQGIESRSRLSELGQTAALIPNQGMLITTLPLLEAQASSEIENIVTTAESLFQYSDADAGADPATREVLRYRRALLEGFRALATGTGKTSIAFQIAWKLFQARWNLSDWRGGNVPSHRPKILFLADRNNLANQAYNDFTSFAAFAEDALVRIKPDEIRQRNRVPTNGSIFFTIFQTFMSGGDANSPVRPERSEGSDGQTLRAPQGERQGYFGDYPPDFFDVIIIDECHRGGANDESSWRDILNYFSPAVQLGLTATPKRNDNVDTYAYFGEPVFTYSLKDGINDGFLTPFRVRQIATTLDDYVYTPDDLLIEGEIEAGRRYEEADFNRVIEIGEREAYRVKLFMQQIDSREKSDCVLRHANACARGARPHQSDENQHGPRLL